jgi:hypothetical protein
VAVALGSYKAGKKRPAAASAKARLGTGEAKAAAARTKPNWLSEGIMDLFDAVQFVFIENNLAC